MDNELIERLRDWKLIRFKDRTKALHEAADRIEALQTRADHWESACEMAIEQKHEVSSKYKALCKKYRELEAANTQRKQLNAQMLMNAAESGNRNYLAEIEALGTENTKLKTALRDLWETSFLSSSKLWLNPETRKLIEGLYHDS